MAWNIVYQTAGISSTQVIPFSGALGFSSSPSTVTNGGISRTIQPGTGSVAFTQFAPTVAVNALTITPVPPFPDAATGIPYELVFTVTNSANLISWVLTTNPDSATITSLSTSTALFAWTPSGIPATFVLKATDTVTGNFGTVTI